MVTIEQRFWAKVKKGAPDECWPWQASIVGKGYGQFWDGERQLPAHRWAYEALVGSIPDGLTLDHLCRNPACVNPAHLEPVTNRENIMRGHGVVASNARKTSCRHGHPLSGPNLIVERENGAERRRCRECRNEASRRYRAKKAS